MPVEDLATTASDLVDVRSGIEPRTSRTVARRVDHSDVTDTSEHVSVFVLPAVTMALDIDVVAAPERRTGTASTISPRGVCIDRGVSKGVAHRPVKRAPASRTGNARRKAKNEAVVALHGRPRRASRRH